MHGTKNLKYSYL